MKKYKNILVVLLSVLLLACTHGNKTEKELLHAEAVMNEHFDSMLCIMQSIENPERLPAGETQARYALLMTQAMYKNDIPIDDDSLISVAVGYYAGSGDAWRYARSLFYKGIVVRTLQDGKKALDYFKQAEELTPRFEDDYLKAQIYECIGDINDNAYLTKEAKDYFLKGYHHAKKTGLPVAIYNAASRLTNAYLCLEMPDSSEYYYEQLILLLPQMPQPYRPHVMANIAYYYNDNVPEKRSIAEEYLLEAIESEYISAEDRARAINELGVVYNRTGRSEKADSLWAVVLSGNDADAKGITYHRIYESEKEQKNFEKALVYHELYLHFFDSILENKDNITIAEIQAKYDREVVERRAAEERSRNAVYLNLLLSSVLVLAFSIAYILWNKRRKERRAERSIRESEQIIDRMQNELDALHESSVQKDIKNEQTEERIKVLEEKIMEQFAIIKTKERASKPAQEAAKRSVEIAAKCWIHFVGCRTTNHCGLFTQHDYSVLLEGYRSIDEEFVCKLDEERLLSYRDKVISVFLHLDVDKEIIMDFMKMSDMAFRSAKSRILHSAYETE